MSLADSGLEIRKTADKGRALTSTRSIAAGAIILTLPPLILLPTLSHIHTVCSHCLKPGEPRACTRCRSAYYCGAACQRQHWQAIHSKECKALGKVQTAGRGHLPTPVRLLMQVLLKDELGMQMADLEGHTQAWRDGGKWADLEMMATAACAYAGIGTGAEQVGKACDLMCKIQTNAFNWSDGETGQVGVFLEPKLAMMNHTCMPNAMVEVIGRKIVLRAEKSISSGEAIEISYTDYTQPKKYRQEALKPYNFQCQCPRCSDNLGIYQVCAAYPDIQLNRLSLEPDVVKHPAILKEEKPVIANSESEKASRNVTSSTSDAGYSSKATIQTNYRHCKGLIDNDLWAMPPVPTVMADISTYYAEQEMWTCALVTACLVASACDPYRYPAPFHPVRVRGLLMIAKLLANTAADTASTDESTASNRSKDSEIQKTLSEIDQVSLCELLLLLILRQSPPGHVDEWEVSASAQAMLKDIRELPGREQEHILIDAWAKDPTNEESEAFFKYAVVDPVHTLAELGKAQIASDFGS